MYLFFCSILLKTQFLTVYRAPCLYSPSGSVWSPWDGRPRSACRPRGMARQPGSDSTTIPIKKRFAHFEANYHIHSQFFEGLAKKHVFLLSFLAVFCLFRPTVGLLVATAGLGWFFCAFLPPGLLILMPKTQGFCTSTIFLYFSRYFLVIFLLKPPTDG